MTDIRREWISKRAYALWEQAGRPHGLDGVHWDQAERERVSYEQNALGSTTTSKKRVKPLIELSEKASPTDTVKTKKRAAAEKPAMSGPKRIKSQPSDSGLN